MSSVESKIDKLAEKLQGGPEHHLREVDSMRTVFKSAKVRQALARNPAMEQLLNLLRKREQGYSMVLSNKADMPEDQRRSFFAKRVELRFILSFFESAEKSMKSLEDELDYQLEDEVRSVDKD